MRPCTRGHFGMSVSMANCPVTSGLELVMSSMVQDK